jgi:hypothetical protein
MNTQQYVIEKQISWANRNGFIRIGSEGALGKKNYLENIENNLYTTLSTESKKDIEQGDGNELKSNGHTCSLQALHSSCAIEVNFFEFLRKSCSFSKLAKMLKIPSTKIEYINYEKKFPVYKRTSVIEKVPNIDVCFHYSTGSIIGIECKFTEPFNRREEYYQGMKEKYFTHFLYWDVFPNIKEYSNKIKEENRLSKYLDTAQLIKHVLGMYNLLCNKEKIKLVYLYLPAIMENNGIYEEELELLRNIFKADGISFSYISWQNAVSSGNVLYDEFSADERKWFDYFSDRYM